MNIALPATPSLWSPLHAWLRRLVPDKPSPMRQTPAFARQPELLSRPLRVVRILEVGQSSAQVGRMMISGRMADVCAELDRLAASEATRH